MTAMLVLTKTDGEKPPLRCGSCKHWDEKAAKAALWGDCKIAASIASAPVSNSSLATAQDENGMTSADLCTHEMFGCIQWEIA